MEEFEGIPVNLSDLSVDAPVMEESQVYSAVLEKVAVSMKPDKGGRVFCSVQCSIPDGDYEGYVVQTNWLVLPYGVRPDASKRAKIQQQKDCAPFTRFARSFRITGTPPVVSLGRPESIQAFQDWIAKSYGNRGKIMIQNQEFPQGSGRKRSGINEWIF